VTSYTFSFILFTFLNIPGITPTSKIVHVKTRVTIKVHFFIAVLFFFPLSMKMLVIPDLWAVGMHHWDGRSLTVGAGYKIEWDENNPKDPSAVCIKEDGKIKAYLKKEHAFHSFNSD
jgi:hypothetical protein